MTIAGQTVSLSGSISLPPADIEDIEGKDSHGVKLRFFVPFLQFSISFSGHNFWIYVMGDIDLPF